MADLEISSKYMSFRLLCKCNTPIPSVGNFSVEEQYMVFGYDASRNSALSYDIPGEPYTIRHWAVIGVMVYNSPRITSGIMTWCPPVRDRPLKTEG